MNKLDCKEFRERIFIYPEIDYDFYIHLTKCPSCKDYFEEWMKIEETLRNPILEKEIDLEWESISKNIERRINWEKYQKIFLISILSLIGVLFSFLIFVFIFRFLNISLILWGISLILKRISNLLSYFAIFLILFLAIKNELDIKSTKKWR